MIYMVIPLSEIKKEERVATSIKVKPSVWQEAKIAAIKESITVSELVEDAIKCWITEQAKKRKEK